MKKIIRKYTIVIFMGIMAFSLCACGKSTETREVEELISAIGYVSFDSIEQIEKAEAAYNSLTDEEKNQVENYNILLEARKTYDSLGIQLTVDNYEKYLDFSCSRKLTGAIDYGQAMGASKNIGQYVYTAIEIESAVKGKSSNYDYSDVMITVKVTGYYVPYSQDIMKKINRGELELEDYYKDNMKPVDITLNISTDFIGAGSDSSIISIPDGYWVMDESVQIGYEVIEVTGIMTK